MKKLILLFAAGLFLFSCDTKKDSANELPEGYRMLVVKETMDASKYTYMKGTENGKDIWIATTTMAVNVGDTIYFTGGNKMKDFKSKSLDKTFETILFLDEAFKELPMKSAQGQMPQQHPEIAVQKDESVNITPPEGGYSIQSVYENKNDLSGKSVKVKGKVTKFNEQIMNRNWIHIQDGTGMESNTFDLLITTQQSVKVGDIIEAEGTVSIEKDFGAGYKYDVLVEDAKITVTDANKPAI